MNWRNSIRGSGPGPASISGPSALCRMAAVQPFAPWLREDGGWKKRRCALNIVCNGQWFSLELSLAKTILRLKANVDSVSACETTPVSDLPNDIPWQSQPDCAT